MKQNHHCVNIPSFFRVACKRFSRTCRNDGNPLKSKLPLFIDCCLPYPILPFTPSYWFIQLQNCFDNRNVDTFVSKMYFWKISKICDFWLKTRFFTKNFFFSLKAASMEQKTDLSYGHWFRFYSVLKHLSLD